MKIYIILLLTLTLRILSEINFPALTSDNAALIEAAKNFSNDSKFSNSWVESADLSVVKSESLARWPIGHSSVIAGLNLMTNNLIYAEILFQ
ncbi:MAG: hypothetical protein ACXWE7_13475, partial [Nitrososphaeraceae archaeon]